MKLGWILFAIPALAQTAGGNRSIGALQERAITHQAAGLNTDDRIQMYQRLAKAEPGRLHFQNLLAATFIQKVRETTDFSYLDRAARILERVLASDGENYEALRLRTEIELERHEFARAA